jgi:hypothetical protein
MVPYYGDFAEDDTVDMVFNSFTSDDPSASATITNFINTDVHIHKDLGLEQRNNAAGITVSVDLDGITGNHAIKIDTSDNTVAGFWTTGSEYQVRIEGTTIDGATINAWVGTFSIERAGGVLALLKAGTVDVNTKTITNGIIVAATLGADCITSAKIADNALANEHFADGALTSTEITSAAGCVLSDAGVDAIWDEATAGHTDAGSMGLALSSLFSTIVVRVGQCGDAGTGTTIDLDAGASAVNDFYKGQLIAIVLGTGAGQARSCTGYAGDTKIATVTPAWATNPDGDSYFAILNTGSTIVVDWADGGRLDLIIDAIAAGVNLTKINGESVVGNAATLTLKQLDIQNDAGPAIYASGTTDGVEIIGTSGSGFKASSTGNDGHGMELVGEGSGEGLNATAGATGNGIEAVSTAGAGIYSSSAGGDGMKLIAGGAAGHGLNCDGSGSGEGISATGGPTGHGIQATSGATSGDGINATAATSGNGISATAAGTGDGIIATSGDGATGAGIAATAASTNGAGICSTGSGSGPGVHAVGGLTGDGLNATAGGTSGHGIYAKAAGTGDGLSAHGGGVAGDGIHAEADNEGDGIEGVGAGAGIDLNAGEVAAIETDTKRLFDATGCGDADSPVAGSLAESIRWIRWFVKNEWRIDEVADPDTMKIYKDDNTTEGYGFTVYTSASVNYRDPA